MDLISRDEAIDLLLAEGMITAAIYLEHMPSAEKTGKWIHDYDDELVSGICSVCGWRSIIMETDVADMPFCPNCGARMMD